MGLCHFALALLVLLEVVAQVDTQKMVRAQCGARPRACKSIHFLLLPALPLGHGLQFSQVGRGFPLSQARGLLSRGFKFPEERGDMGVGGAVLSVP